MQVHGHDEANLLGHGLKELDFIVPVICQRNVLISKLIVDQGPDDQGPGISHGQEQKRFGQRHVATKTSWLERLPIKEIRSIR